MLLEFDLLAMFTFFVVLGESVVYQKPFCTHDKYKQSSTILLKDVLRNQGLDRYFVSVQKYNLSISQWSGMVGGS